MDLNTYVHNLLDDEASTYSPSWLEIPTTLGNQLLDIIAGSEQAVKEMGCQLHWRNNELVLEKRESGDVNVHVGEHDKISMNTEVAYLQDDYIGNFHNHPYQKKYASLAAIGPSSGDWSTWSKFFPSKKSCGIRMVSSGSELFLVIFRKKPDSFKPGKIDETGRMLAFTWGDNDEANNYRQLLMNEQYLESGEVLKESFPRAARFHEQDVERMNCELALLNQCEYYRGILKRDSVSYVYLKSQRILGNWLTTKFWSKSSAPWIHSKLF